MKTTGKLVVVKNEIKRVGLLIYGISETHWNTVGKFISGEGNFVFSSGKGGQIRVATIVDGRCKHPVLGTRTINDRMAVVRITTAPFTVSVLLQMKTKWQSLSAW